MTGVDVPGRDALERTGRNEDVLGSDRVDGARSGSDVLLGGNGEARLAHAEIRTDDWLDFVCRRTAEIVFDPAWLEVHLPLDEVSVDLRRAAIDLDPDWLPWFGAVVRFVYG